jgi:hypothetical protein
LFFTKANSALAKRFHFLCPLLVLMFISLTYTPDLAAGRRQNFALSFPDIVARLSFLLVDTPQKIRRFLAGLLFGGV